jgi:hypothetical protein
MPKPGGAFGPRAPHLKNVCLVSQTLYNIPMAKAETKFKVPDVEKDRKLIVKESKRDLKEMMEEKAPLDNLAELAEALRKAKAKRKKK